MLKKDFWYDLPKELIAQEPASPRDAARLMVLSQKDDSIQHRIFHDLPEYLEPGDLLVVNNSKVLPARLRNNYVKKFRTSIQFWHETGGGLDEAVIRELEAHGYPILRNGVSNYTRDKKSRIIFTGPIPDDTDDIKSSKDIPSWKRMCYCILKNDHNCRFMGFGLTRQQQRRIDIIRKKYKSVEAMENGV